MPTRNIVLTDQQALWVQDMVDTGRYQNASEVLRAGLRLLQHAESSSLLLPSEYFSRVVNVAGKTVINRDENVIPIKLGQTG